MKSAKLTKQADSALRSGHPWIFSRAIDQIDAETGEVVRLHNQGGDFQGLYSYHKGNTIALRLLMSASEVNTLGFEEKQESKFLKNFFALRMQQAHNLRRRLFTNDTTGFRYLNAEGDNFPGLVIDRYGETGVIQVGTIFTEKNRDLIIESLKHEFGFKNLWEKSSGRGRKQEGLEPRRGCLYGDAEAHIASFLEHGMVFTANLKTGQKTGFFFDQRENRQLVFKRAKNARMLNLFGYTGAFALWALQGGATYAVNIDESKAANDQALIFASKYAHSTRFEALSLDVESYFESNKGHKFDLVVCDPPAFAKKQGDKEQAVRAYAHLNKNALGFVKAGGEFFTFSCSQHILEEEFYYAFSRAVKMSGRTVKILKRLSAAADHPSAPGHPEMSYLKGYWCLVEN